MNVAPNANLTIGNFSTWANYLCNASGIYKLNQTVRVTVKNGTALIKSGNLTSTKQAIAKVTSSDLVVGDLTGGSASSAVLTSSGTHPVVLIA